MLNLSHMIAYSEEYNLRFKFKTQDGGGRKIYKRGFYEERVTNYLLSELSLSSDDIVFDVGANIGWYSCLLSRAFPGIEIHCFEPDPENYDTLISNLRRNEVEKVVPNQLGVGEKAEIKKLYLYKKSNVGRHSMLKINQGPTIDVPLTSFDEYVQENGLDFSRIKFLKIDIEGFEYFAFLGGSEYLKHVPIVMAEFSPGYMRQGGIEPADLLSLLRSNNYDPFRIEGLDLIPMQDDELLGRDHNINLIWKKKS